MPSSLINFLVIVAGRQIQDLLRHEQQSARNVRLIAFRAANSLTALRSSPRIATVSARQSGLHASIEVTIRRCRLVLAAFRP